MEFAGVVYTSRLPAAIEEELETRFGARHVGPADADFCARLTRTWGLVAGPGASLDSALIHRLPGSVRIIASYSVGVDHIDIEAARIRGIVVTNTPDVVTNATADVAMLLILSACRQASWAERRLRAGEWRGASLLDTFGVDLAGRTLGIFGYGRIGQATARRGVAFGMQIVYHGRHPRAVTDLPGARFEAQLHAFLAASDIVSLHVPLTPATRHVVDRDAIAAMRPGSILVNTARGGLVDDEALIEALRSGHLRAAGLDVYDSEPRIRPGYLTLDNVTLLPHIGTATIETRLAMGRAVIANLKAFREGREPPGWVRT